MNTAVMLFTMEMVLFTLVNLSLIGVIIAREMHRQGYNDQIVETINRSSRHCMFAFSIIMFTIGLSVKFVGV